MHGGVWSVRWKKLLQGRQPTSGASHKNERYHLIDKEGKNATSNWFTQIGQNSSNRDMKNMEMV